MEETAMPNETARWAMLALPDSGANWRVDVQALLGYVNLATTQIYTNVGQARMEKVVARL